MSFRLRKTEPKRNKKTKLKVVHVHKLGGFGWYFIVVLILYVILLINGITYESPSEHNSDTQYHSAQNYI